MTEKTRAKPKKTIPTQPGQTRGTYEASSRRWSERLQHRRRRQLGKSKDRPKVGRPDRTETVGPRKWTGPVSVQIRSGLGQAFGLGPKAKIRKSENPSFRVSSFENPSFRGIAVSYLLASAIFRLPPSPSSSKIQASSGFRHLPASAISIIIVKPLQTTVSIFYLLGFPILLALYL